VLGSEAFRQELLAAMVGRVGPSHYGAERIVKEELGRMGWLEEELRGRPKGHPGKVVIARRLRQETTMSLKWIAKRLQMGTWTYVSNLLNQRVEASPSQEVLLLCQWLPLEQLSGLPAPAGGAARVAASGPGAG